MSDSRRIRAVLFDLDGTLLDTADDLIAALNRVLAEEGREAAPAEKTRPHVSKGGMAITCRGFGITDDDPRAEALRDRVIRHYRANICHHTRLFPGMAELLQAIEASRRYWGVVTNKQAFLTEPLLEKMGLAERPACIVSGDTLPRKKPHPDPLLHVCATIGCMPEETLYVGDDARDIEAGRRAGMTTLAALYGYIADDEDPADWGADGLVRSPAEIHDWLD
ncbi:MAG: HAD-IA family hydrolase [Pseudomonadota bacterium]|nr:HAD-IA family hydrolase [Pseudomonadota bacterium]